MKLSVYLLVGLFLAANGRKDKRKGKQNTTTVKPTGTPPLGIGWDYYFNAFHNTENFRRPQNAYQGYNNDYNYQLPYQTAGYQKSGLQQKLAHHQKDCELTPIQPIVLQENRHPPHQWIPPAYKISYLDYANIFMDNPSWLQQINYETEDSDDVPSRITSNFVKLRQATKYERQTATRKPTTKYTEKPTIQPITKHTENPTKTKVTTESPLIPKSKQKTKTSNTFTREKIPETEEGGLMVGMDYFGGGFGYNQDWLYTTPYPPRPSHILYGYVEVGYRLLRNPYPGRGEVERISKPDSITYKHPTVSKLLEKLKKPCSLEEATTKNPKVRPLYGLNYLDWDFQRRLKKKKGPKQRCFPTTTPVTTVATEDNYPLYHDLTDEDLDVNDHYLKKPCSLEEATTKNPKVRPLYGLSYLDWDYTPLQRRLKKKKGPKQKRFPTTTPVPIVATEDNYPLYYDLTDEDFDVNDHYANPEDEEIERLLAWSYVYLGSTEDICKEGNRKCKNLKRKERNKEQYLITKDMLSKYNNS